LVVVELFVLPDPPGDDDFYLADLRALGDGFGDERGDTSLESPLDLFERWNTQWQEPSGLAFIY
jgi:hypothetical protein